MAKIALVAQDRRHDIGRAIVACRILHGQPKGPGRQRDRTALVLELGDGRDQGGVALGRLPDPSPAPDPDPAGSL